MGPALPRLVAVAPAALEAASNEGTAYQKEDAIAYPEEENAINTYEEDISSSLPRTRRSPHSRAPLKTRVSTPATLL